MNKATSRPGGAVASTLAFHAEDQGSIWSEAGRSPNHGVNGRGAISA